ncbi:MAG: hypothetical protein RLZZ303_879 [Candidatus Hydrogenedentota bacterium]|jgi:AbrB family looped-hinge helix DNA binding protein
MKTSISSKGQIVIPVEFRRQDALHPGQEFEIERLESGRYLLELKSKPPNEGLLDILLSCPVKDWFEPVERTQNTDDIVLPRL